MAAFIVEAVDALRSFHEFKIMCGVSEQLAGQSAEVRAQEAPKEHEMTQVETREVARTCFPCMGNSIANLPLPFKKIE